MKIKNIAFSGFMAAIMLSTGAAMAAPQIASKAYVDNKATAAVTAALENGAIKTALDAKANASTVEELADAVNDKTTGLVATKAIADAAKDAATTNAGNITTLQNTVAEHTTDISGLKTDVATKASASDLTALTSRVSANETKIGDATLNTTAQNLSAAINELKTKTDGMATSGNIETLTAAVETNKTNISKNTDDIATLNGGEGVVGSVAKSIADAVASTKTAYEAADATTLQSAQDYADGLADNYATAAQGAQAEQNKTDIATINTNLAKKADKLTVDAAKVGNIATVDANGQYQVSDKKLTDFTSADDVAGTITEKITALDLANTYEAKGAAAGVRSALEADIATKADKATTLEGYGITDAMTETEIKGYAIPKPGAICTADSGRCVLSVDKTGNLYWVDVTKPIDDETSSS